MSAESEFQSMSALAERLHRRDLSPVELAESSLARIESLDAKLHAFVELTPERALAEARAAEAELGAGVCRGPLHGVPYVAKDLFDVQGLATRAGTRLLAGRVAERDAWVVQRLRAAGMVLLGKTHTVQFAFGAVGINHDTGTPHNPWHSIPHAPGGSSSGTAVAVASGMTPMGLGSDTGGSVRIPAAHCGVSGLKTTVGRISRRGVYPLSETLDSVGPLGRTVKDCALAYEAMQGADPQGDPSTAGQSPHEVMSALDLGVRGLRLAFAETAFWDGADPAVVEAVRATAKAFEDLGARVGSTPFPEAGEVMGGVVERHRAMMIAAEACAFNRRLLDEHLSELDPVVANRMITGRNLLAPDYFETLREWRRLQRSADLSLRDVDALLVPTCAATARPVTEIDTDPESYAAWNGLYLRNTAIGNMLDLSAVSVPCGFDAEGMPIGLMIYAKAFHEDMALRVAHAYQLATEWHLQQPDLRWARP